jgi:dienelactone hydrolase
MMNLGLKLFAAVALLEAAGLAQSVHELEALKVPQSIALSQDGSRLWYKLGGHSWEIGTGPNSRPKRIDKYETASADRSPEVLGTGRRSASRRSRDGKKVAYLDAEGPFGPLLLFCLYDNQKGNSRPQPLSRLPVLEFEWASDSNSLWVIAVNGADEPVGRLDLNGNFEKVSRDPAMRRLGGLTAAADVVAWVQSDGSHHGAIWARNRAGTLRLLVDPNPAVSKWKTWTQEVVRWKNAHAEELQGILARPSGGAHLPLPLVVDPYSSWRNRFLHIPVLGNYLFVKAGFAVFFPDHRAPHTFPEMSFGEGYVGAAKDRDPVDVLTDDVMTGVNELVRSGIADRNQLFLYSSSNGASAINQLLTETHEFRAAVSHGGVANWLGYYQNRRRLGDETIPGFLGGRKPEDSLELYRRISPVFHVDRISTPLLLVIGEKDTRFEDTMEFYRALSKAGSPVSLVTYPEEGHELSTASLAEQHVRRALDFFRAAKPVQQ